MHQVVVNDYVDVSLTVLFMGVVSVMLVVGAGLPRGAPPPIHALRQGRSRMICAVLAGNA
ncbi:MAG: hypothetical protein WDN04_20755 [Rhodospirillales bacterium]